MRYFVKPLFALAISSALLSGSMCTAFAADMPLEANAPPPPPVVGWSGWYVGANLGGNWVRNSIDVVTAPVSSFGGVAGIITAHGAPAAASATGTLGGNRSSFMGGGQIGYNWQSRFFVGGIEADIQGFARNGSLTGSGVALVGPGSGVTGTPDNTTFTGSKSLDYFGTIRGRLGLTATPAVLVYATGGLAYGRVSTSAGFTTVNNAYPGVGLSSTWGTAGSTSATRAGWTVGGGLEWMFAPHWSVKGEYLYYDLGSVTYGLGSSGSIVLPGFGGAGSPWFTNSSTASTKFTGSIARVGINYAFGGGPVVAKY
jgi:outer membrane immunogenic protein